jgi:hypothetical protein
MFDKTKILLPEIISVDIHWSPLSLLKEVGDLEISSSKGDIYFKHCPNPNHVKVLITERCQRFKRV